jgi:CTP synthase
VTSETIYEVPLLLEDAGLGEVMVSRLGLKAKKSDLDEWRKMVAKLKAPREPVVIGLVGKYVELQDAYYSVREALCHAALAHNREIRLEWLDSEEIESGEDDKLRQVQGIIVPGGFGYRGIEGMIEATNFAREKEIPYFGLCLGMHTMVIEFGRHVFHTEKVNSTEFDTDTAYPVIDLLPEQHGISQKGGTMRLGTYPCNLVAGTKAAQAYGSEVTYERHRHRFEFNNSFRQPLREAGLIPSGLSPNGELVEIAELEGHPWMLACQFHPEFKSRPDSPHPLFMDFIGAAKKIFVEGAQTSLPLN